MTAEVVAQVVAEEGVGWSTSYSLRINLLKVRVFERATESKGENRERSFNCWFVPQTAGEWGRPKPALTPPWSPLCLTELKNFPVFSGKLNWKWSNWDSKRCFSMECWCHIFFFKILFTYVFGRQNYSK